MEPSQEHQPPAPPPPPPPTPPLDQPRRPRPPTRLLVSRSYTIAALLIAFSLMIADAHKKTGGPTPGHAPPKGTHQPPPPPPLGGFKIADLGSLQSVLAVSAIGIACNIYQLGMLIHSMVTGNDLAYNKYNVFFNYYGDKAVALLLAASAGAGLVSMLDIRQVRAPFKFMKSFFSAGALLATATISASVSSTCSSEALWEYRRTLEKGEKAVGVLGVVGRCANRVCHYCCCN